MLSSSAENLSARRYSSSMVASGSKDKDLKNKVVIQNFSGSFAGPHPYCNLLDGLPEPACEVPDGFVFSFEDSLEGADVPFLPDLAQILGDEHGPQLDE